jgi:hypothetical protein
MSGFLTREVPISLGEEPTEDQRSMIDVIDQLRDELTVLTVKNSGAPLRSASMVLAKLDEARLWAIDFGLKTGSHLLLDKRKYAEGLAATATDETQEKVTVG